jgi:hypothetical protein
MADVDSFMMFLDIGGLVLWAAYLRAQYRDWRRQKSAAAQEKDQVRLLYQVEPAGLRESLVHTGRSLPEIADCPAQVHGGDGRGLGTQCTLS